VQCSVFLVVVVVVNFAKPNRKVAVEIVCADGWRLRFIES